MSANCLQGLTNSMASVVITLCVVLILHELTHGLFFWLFTKSRPAFGFKGWYAYAAAPGWYLPRAQFLVVVGAPLTLLSLLGEALLLLVPWAVVPWKNSSNASTSDPAPLRGLRPCSIEAC